MSGPAGHVHERSEERWRLRGAIAITAIILAVELLGGWLANSLALLSDAGHVFMDLGALALSYAAFVLSVRPATARKTFGWYRLEILAAAVNGALLIALAVWVFVESSLRLRSPQPILTTPLLVAAIIGLAGNLVALYVLYGGRRNMNIHGALLHVAGDTLSSVGVIVAGVVVLFTGWTPVDALAGMLIAAVLIVGAVRLLARSVDVLLEATPTGIDLIEVSDAISGVAGVAAVHDLHIWSMSTTETALTAHLVMPQGYPGDIFVDDTAAALKHTYSIDHCTLQVELGTTVHGCALHGQHT
jgi:cobalt-zinc-cadmium efflux system protein